MSAIYKYELPTTKAEALVVMPRHAHMLTAQTQNNRICVWAVVAPSWPTVHYRFLLLETGEAIEAIGDLNLGTYLGTCQLNGGRDVMHVFYAGIKEVGEP